MVLGACLLHEHTSLKAFWLSGAQLEARDGKRQEIMKRRKAKDDYISSWFSYPAGEPSRTRPSARARARAARGGWKSGRLQELGAVRDRRHARHPGALWRL